MVKDKEAATGFGRMPRFRGRMRRLLHKTHIWLGWIIGAQLFLWMLSGLLMAAMPIGQVRGEHLRAAAPMPPLPHEGLAPPAQVLAGSGADTLVLTSLLERPVYRLERSGKAQGLKDAGTGEAIRLDEALARRIAVERYAGSGKPVSVGWTAVDAPPREFRRNEPAFAVRFDDAEGTVFYVHGITGDVAAVRTNRWRLFDLMWGLHILDWREREDFNHPLLIGAAALGLASATGGIALLLMRLRGRRKRGAQAQAGV